MISGNFRKAAVDSNILLSAVIGKSALRIFVRPEFEWITTAFNAAEVDEYLPRLAAKYGLDLKALLWQRAMMPLTVYPKAHYQSHWDRAEKWLKHRDPDDIHLAALALKEGVPIWSNDRDFQGFETGVFTTAQLLKWLDLQ